MSDRIIVFTRYPEPGKTKTRLIPSLGPKGAADLHRRMTEHTLDRVRSFARMVPVSIEVCYAGADLKKLRDWLGAGLAFRRQRGGSLGDRLAGAFQDAFAAGMRRVVIIGSDCPAISGRLLQEAFDSLSEHELVLGPAADGGYYLIGLRRARPGLFRDIPWGTGVVFEETLHRAGESGVTVGLLPIEADVDRPEDLHHWQGALHHGDL